MKRLLMLILVMLLVAGAGAGWWFFLRQAPDADTAEDVSKAQPAKAERFLELEPVQVPIIREGRVTALLTIVVAVELTEPMVVDESRPIMLPLRDAIVSELHAVYALRYVQNRGERLSFISERLRMASEQVLGTGAVRNILIQNVQTRKTRAG